MVKKTIKTITILLLVAILMFAEYRVIMHNLKPQVSDSGTIYIEIFGHIDAYND